MISKLNVILESIFFVVWNLVWFFFVFFFVFVLTLLILYCMSKLLSSDCVWSCDYQSVWYSRKAWRLFKKKNWKFCFRPEYWIGQKDFRGSNCPVTFFLFKNFSCLLVSVVKTVYPQKQNNHLLNCVFLTTLTGLIKSINYSKLHNGILKDFTQLEIKVPGWYWPASNLKNEIVLLDVGVKISNSGLQRQARQVGLGSRPSRTLPLSSVCLRKERWNR